MTGRKRLTESEREIEREREKERGRDRENWVYGYKIYRV